jgi:riboflavin kinase / FMN adenylyltransferase
MKVHHLLQGLPSFSKPVITIGSFDGVHYGHRKILSQLVAKAKEIEGESIVISFEPHPRVIVHPDDDSLKILTTLQEKTKLLSELGIDHFVVVNFNDEFKNQSAEEYVQNFLVKNFQPHTIIIGFDHQFGKDRTGNISLLQSLAPAYHFELIEISQQLLTEVKVSSTVIRKNLIEGNIQQANTLLQSNYSISGTVVHGDARGRTIGYPTANIQIHNKYKLIPCNGVYAIRASFQGMQYNGMMNIGNRPTIEQTNRISLEVHLFDFNKDIYDESITIYFHEKMRDEKKFNGLEELIHAIQQDEKIARNLLD